ncbi:MAG: hypothetical protein KDA88_22045 [Planctomycetaceae bacterium]|nr:hypothetical protein [Planctomycetaceae bacterium]MCB9954048.1 hypothetical protein [Planctomycetaceae bacterium]
MTRICALLLAVGCFIAVPGTTQAAPRPNPKLIKKVTLKWEDQPVVEGIVKEIEAIGMKVSVDTAAIEEEGLEGAKDTLELTSVPLYPALQQIARLHSLYIINNGTDLKVVPRTQADEEYVEVTYSLQGLQGAVTDEEEFNTALRAACDFWQESGDGKGEYAVLPAARVVISQTHPMHEELAKTFSMAELALRGRTPNYLDPRTQLTLRKEFQFASDEISLEEQFQNLLGGVNFLFDRASIADEEIHLSAKSAPPSGSDTVINQLAALCAASNLEWSVRDGLLVIETAERLCCFVKLRWS